MKIAERLADPVFQLNVVLWSLIDFPDIEGIFINPALGRAGYSVYALDRKVMLPDKQEITGSIIEMTGRLPDPAVPDVWLEHESDNVYPILELKSHGFGLESKKKVTQMLKIMAGSYDLTVSTGVAFVQSGHVIYVTVADDIEPMTGTLKSLESELKKFDIPSAPSAIIGLAEQGGSVTLVSPEPDQLPEPLKRMLTEPVIILKAITKDYNVTPLYLVPWSPNISNNSDFEQEGLEILTERVLVYVEAEVGRNTSEEKVTIDCEEILNNATIEVFQYWQGDVRKRFIEKAKDIIIRKTEPHSKSKSRSMVDIDLANGNREDVLKKLARTKVKDVSRDLLEATIPTLFDNILE